MRIKLRVALTFSERNLLLSAEAGNKISTGIKIALGGQGIVLE
jgi:hypothetical protein